MPEKLKHANDAPAPNKRNGIFIGGYVKENVAQYIKTEAGKENKTISHFLNTHFQNLMNKENGSKK